MLQLPVPQLQLTVPPCPQVQSPQQQQPQHQRAYALNQKQVEKNGVPIIIHFDTGASHSFISTACVDTFEIKV